MWLWVRGGGGVGGGVSGYVECRGGLGGSVKCKGGIGGC